MQFSWQKYFSTMGFKECISREVWERAITRFIERHPRLRREVTYASQLLYLAYRDGHDQNEHVTNGDYVRRISLPCDQFRLGYGGFQQDQSTRSKLRDGLEFFGGELLQAGKRNQYLRTIRKYSGSMYVRFAKTVADIVQRSSWNKLMEPEYLNKQLSNQLRQYFGDDEDGEQSKQDVVVFFQSIARQFRFYNQPVSPEDSIFSAIPYGVARNIICKMGLSPETLEKGVTSEFDTLPTLMLTLDGEPVYVLPKEGHFASGIEHVIYLFRSVTGEEVAYANYRRRHDGTWVCEWDAEHSLGVSALEVASIVRRRDALHDDSESELKTVEEDVTPLYRKEDASGHILLAVNSIETGCGYALDTSIGKGGIVTSKSKLLSGRRYKVVSFANEIYPIAILVNDAETVLDEVAREDYEREGVFTMPAGADGVKICDVFYACENRANNYLNDDVRSVTAAAGSRQRLYFDYSIYPFTVEFNEVCGDGSVSVFYEWDGKRKKIPINEDDWEIPEECRWQRGWLSFSRDDDEVFCRRAVTFIDEPWAPALDVLYDFDAKIEVDVSFGREHTKQIVPPQMGALKFEYRGVKFEMPVKRSGICFNCSGHWLPVRRDKTDRPVETLVARRDFEKTCMIMADDEDRVFATRGMGSLALIEDRKVTGLQLQGMPQFVDETSDYYTFNIGKNANAEWGCYRFRVFDPMRAYVDVEERRRVKIERDGTDLVLRYYIALCDMDVKKSLAFYPAHRQDKIIEWVNTVEINRMEHEFTSGGRCIETLTIPNFYDLDIDWGEGLLCYVGRWIKVSDSLNFNIETFTAGFFICRPEGVPSEIVDDPYGLRRAMAKRDYRAIDALLSVKPDDSDKLKWLTDFLKNLERESGRVKAACVNGVKEPARHFMNAFRNVLVSREGGREISGYSFSAWWYHLPRLDAKGRLPQSMRSCWSPLLFGAIVLEDAGQIPKHGAVLPKCSELHYLPVADKKRLRDLVEKVIGDAHQGEMRYSVPGFNYVVFSEAVRQRVAKGSKLKELINNTKNPAQGGFGRDYLATMYSAWRNVLLGRVQARDLATALRRKEFGENVNYRLLKETPRHGQAAFLRCALKKYEGVHYPIYAGYKFDLAFPREEQIHEKTLGDEDVSRFAEKVSSGLSRWRATPRLENARNLREIFMVLEKIDGKVRTLFEHGTLPINGEIPSFLKYINMRAWQLTFRSQR